MIRSVITHGGFCMDRVTLYDGGETTGSPADRVYSSKRMETTGGVGEVPAQINSAKVDKTPECDTICFKRNMDKDESSFTRGTFTTIGLLAAGIGLAGCAHKYGWLNKMNDGKVKSFLTNVFKACHSICADTKSYAKKGYDKVVSLFKKK